MIVAGPAMNVLIAFVILWALFAFHGPYVATDRVGRPSTRARRPRACCARATARRGRRRSGAIRSSCASRSRPHSARARSATAASRPRPRASRCCATGAPASCLRGRAIDGDPEDPRPLLGFTFDATRDPEGRGSGATGAVSGMWRRHQGHRLGPRPPLRLRGGAQAGLGRRRHLRGHAPGDQVRRADALDILAIISLSLAIVNLFPFLPLDGGHMFWALAEKVRGKPVPFSVMERAGVVGFMLVILIFLIGFTNDIDRLRGEGFGVR